MKKRHCDYQIYEPYDYDDPDREYWIQERYYFLWLFPTHFKLMMNEFGDAPIAFNSEGEAQNYINRLVDAQ